jgi:hypothetical protein
LTFGLTFEQSFGLMKSSFYYDVIIPGFGGQGVLVMETSCLCLMKEQVSYSVYGVEMRENSQLHGCNLFIKWVSVVARPRSSLS